MKVVIFTDNEVAKKVRKGTEFRSVDEMPIDKFKGIHYADDDMTMRAWDRQHFAWFVVFCQDRPIAVLSFKIDGATEIVYGCPTWISYISVHPDYKCMGAATLLVKEMFSFCHDAGITRVVQSAYTVDGYSYIKKKFVDTSMDYPHVKFEDNEQMPYEEWPC